MLWTLVLNGATGFITAVTFAFCIPDVKAAISPKYLFTYINM
jgi:hypothetical protein